jgi:hypothetical protein
MRAAILLAIVVLAVSFPSAAATRQDPQTYPAGVLEVANTPLEAGNDFQVQVKATGAPDSIVVTVCRFKSMRAEGPEVCFMNLEARPAGEAYAADTGAVEHPAWKDGWIVGYKVTVETGEAEAHAPSDGDYYRTEVGSPQEPAPEGTAVVEDDAPSAATQAAGPAAGAKDAPFPWSLALLGLAAAVLARRR